MTCNTAETVNSTLVGRLYITVSYFSLLQELIIYTNLFSYCTKHQYNNNFTLC